MSLSIVKKNVSNSVFKIRFLGKIKVYKIYKNNSDNTFIDVYGTTFDAEDSSIRIDMVGFDSLVVIYDKVYDNSQIEISDYSSDYSYFYSCSFSKLNISEKSIYIDPILANMGNTGISATVIATINDKVEVFEFPVNGNFVASSSYTIDTPVSEYNYSGKDSITNQSFSIYTPKRILETENFIFNRNTITNKTESQFNLVLELKIFSISGKINSSPVIKEIRIGKNDSSI